MSDDDFEDPMIRFGGRWVPAHEVWKKMETATVVNEAIERFNLGFPKLSSTETRKVVPLVRQRLKNIELRMPAKDAEKASLKPLITDLLDKQTPEDALDILEHEHGVKISMEQLVKLAGERKYVDSLTHEAEVYEENRISPEQTAQLWNDSGRPAPGGGLWTPEKVKRLLSHLL
jgi:hypothetical protein